MRMQNTSQQQRGIALVIGLVLLLAVTIMAMAAMHGSRSELLMSGQAQRLRQVQQAAESGIERRFADAANFDTTWSSATPFTEIKMGANEEILVKTTGRYVGAAAAPPGFSLNGQFTAHHFQIISTAGSNPSWAHATDNPDPMQGTTATQVQGFYIIGPGN